MATEFLADDSKPINKSNRYFGLPKKYLWNFFGKHILLKK